MAPNDPQRRIAELTTLNALAQTLNRASDLREALDNALTHIVQLMGLRTGWIFLSDEAAAFRLVARHDLPPAIGYPGSAWRDSCNCQDQCLTGKLTKPVNMINCSRLKSAVGDKRGLAKHASVPLYNGDDLLGILNVATTEFGNFGAPQLQLLAAIGNLLGTAIARTRLHEQVKVRRVQEQATLLQLSQDLLGAASLEPALQRLVRVGARLLEVEACAFVEADEAQGHARLVAAHGWHFLQTAALPQILDSTNPHLWYLPERSAELATDALSELPALLKAQQFQGHLAIAIAIGGVPVGTLMVNERRPRRFLDDEVQLLGLLGSQLAQTLERERLQQDALARQKLEQELDLAREIQASFLPASVPQVPGYSLHALYRAARQVGGDFYDFIDLPTPGAEANRSLRGSEAESEALPASRSPIRPGKPRPSHPMLSQRLGVVIADVTDKGVPAALFMVLSRTLLRASASEGQLPQAVLEGANRLILSDARSGLFVTAFYGILDAVNHSFVYASGGHNYPIWYRAASGQVEQLQAMGIVLGIVPEVRFQECSITIEPGDVICFYTDGVTEAMDQRRQLFGEPRLMETLRRCHHLPPEQISNRIIEAVTNFTLAAPQADDITLVIIKREAA